MDELGRLASFWLAAFVCFVDAVHCETGTFWHISDHHLDPYYTENADPTMVCPSSYGKPTFDAGPFGDYRCDSPWALINSSVYAMKSIKPDPDFIIWTGDDTMHTGEQEKYLGKEKVLEIIANITNIIKDVFPNTKIFPALGNHDYHPKSQIPPGGSEILSAIAEFWKEWLTDEAYELFKQNGFYTETFGPENVHLMMVLNSNFWYDSNKNVDGTGDPADEFKWMETTLSEAKTKGQKVFIIGHVPPGYFELVSDFYKRWYYEEYSQRFLDIIREQYDQTIAGMFFGHHHTDHFKIIKDTNGDPIASLLLAPGVTPWTTTLPGVYKGGNNPGIRLIDYDTDTLELKDYKQYYLPLQKANAASEAEIDPASLWELEYSAVDKYKMTNIGTASWAKLAKDMRDACEANSTMCPKSFDDYHLLNSVSYNDSPCNETCQKFQLCAITEVSVEGYESCQENWGNAGKKTVPGMAAAFLACWLARFLV